MPLYLFSYNLPQGHENEYKELWNYMDVLKAKRVLYSQYIVPLNDDASDLANGIIKKYLKTGDRLLVCELFKGKTNAWHNLRISDTVFQYMLADHARSVNE